VRFHSLSIQNLRAIRSFSIDDLGDFIVIAGQNGSGKSCVFDAIRLLKSVYGGSAANEYQQWFGEFQINLADPQSIQKMFRDPAKPVEIEATFSFSESEVIYLLGNIDSLVQPVAWQQVTGQPVDSWSFSRLAVATQLRTFQPQLTAVSQRLIPAVTDALLRRPVHTIAVKISPSGEIETTDCSVAEVAFQADASDHLGVIEYHSASRSYSRQVVGGINLDARAFEDQRRQQRLYNWQNKYQNVKTELASSYLRSLISRESGEITTDDLNDTLVELFNTFFPDKTYLGIKPLPHGSLEFPVRVSSGEVHDIDELSSGEKEILYGFLKLKNGTPRGSVVLLDEPELHLNPSLLHGFADFFYRHLGIDQGNQLWLVTHSDTLLRQAVGNANYRVYQMIPASSIAENENQAAEVIADDDVERVTIELIGDLASYRPHGKVVILEGLTENGFDVNVVRRLFPDFARRVNLVSGGSKRRVRDLYTALREAADNAGLNNRFFSIVDRDTDQVLEREAGASEYSWDVYHIENYLLEPSAIRSATTTLLGEDPFASDADVSEALKNIAAGLINRLVLQQLQDELNSNLVRAIKIGGPPDTEDPAGDLMPSVIGSAERVRDLAINTSEEGLRRRAADLRADLEQAFANDRWQAEVPGRLILNNFSDLYLGGRIEASMFRNAVLDKMAEGGIQPAAMKSVLDQILAL
jgi:predicted ATPase